MSAFDEHLDQCYPPYVIGGITIPASRILKECDPIAYECFKYEFEEGENECEYD